MPTIKTINLNGTSYDIGGGLTEDVKQGLLNFAEKAAYSDPDYGQEVYDDLYTAFYDNMWNVTNTLSNASTSNPATKTAKDGTYTAIISANTGYTLDGATVSVTMCGANVTSAVYSNGVVNIPAVTGDVVITVVAVALTVASISAVYTQSGTVYDTDTLDSLKADLVVTATFSDSSTSVVPSADYTLTGTLTVGTSTVTVEYGGQTDTFEVSVTDAREALFGQFFDGYSIAKKSGSVSSPYPQYKPYAYRNSTAARATTVAPCANNGYVFTVTDSSKYAINVVDVTSNEQLSIPLEVSAVNLVGYRCGSKTVGWNTTDSASTPYCWIVLKKNDGTAFTSAELANGAKAVFTYTKS